ncbi:MAG: polyprenyl synthetase family protein [Armatimonadetes bacterium]|nr:polyprenyl synthetase family protein [Armatimonadota bacterium]
MRDDLFVDYLVSASAPIDEYLHRCLTTVPAGSPRDRYLYGILDEFISRGGKRTRPAMALLACEAVGGDPLKALSSGCAIEFFHAAALIHDDIMDASLLRRGQKCAHIIHGVPLAINAGDYALGLVCTIVVRDSLLDDATKLAVLDVIGEMSERTVEGQALDVGWVRDDVYDLTPDDYLDMALGKTGFYSGIAPLKVGAIVGGGPDEERRALEDFGKSVSIAFQIQDDLLNITGDEQTMGKDYLTDVIESKRTLMVVHCLTVAEPADRERLVALLRLKHDKTLDQAAEIVELLKQYGSLDYARSMARDLITEGRSHLSAVPESPARDILASMAKYFLDREK